LHPEPAARLNAPESRLAQPRTAVPFQRFWIRLHAAITVLRAGGGDPDLARPAGAQVAVIGLTSYVVMRVWSAFCFIPEMLSFQKVALDSAPSAELSARVSRWTLLTLA
jgi:hypothetical protein